MIDRIIGRPSASWSRAQVLLVLSTALYQLLRGSKNGPRLHMIRRLNRMLARFSPWQIILGVISILYAARNLDIVLGLAAPEPLARVYSRSYYRATWVATAMDAAFATAMPIRPVWLRDICSVLFTGYYLVYANAADEKLRRFRATCTVEMFRAMWEKTSNRYIRMATALERPSVGILRKFQMQRPPHSKYTRPVKCWLFFNGTEKELAKMTDLIIDVPGGGFIAMTPEQHEERLRNWAIWSKKPILAIEYGKAPEYPYPWAIDEIFDVYQMLHADKGAGIGMSGKRFDTIMTGDSAGGNMLCAAIYKMIESPTPLPSPLAVILSYACLNFNFTSWMAPEHLEILRSEENANFIPGLAEQKDHLSHKSPLSVVGDLPDSRGRRRRGSWRGFNEGFTRSVSRSRSLGDTSTLHPPPRSSTPMASLPTTPDGMTRIRSVTLRPRGYAAEDADGMERGAGPSSAGYHPLQEAEKSILDRVRTSERELHRLPSERTERINVEGDITDHAMEPQDGELCTELTMTSRTGFFQDAILSPSIMRIMAILYIGPAHVPDFATDYYVSPLLAPDRVLEHFPTVLVNCGEKDPLVDDTVIFAGKVRRAKLARQARLTRDRTVSPKPTFSNVDPLRILDESDEDWVQMRIIEGWSHGYLQMLQLIPDVRVVLKHFAVWMQDIFDSRAREFELEKQDLRNARVAAVIRKGSPYARKRMESNGASEAETDDPITFVPKKKRSPPSSFAAVPDEDGSSGSRSSSTLTGPSTPETNIVDGLPIPTVRISGSNRRLETTPSRPERYINGTGAARSGQASPPKTATKAGTPTVFFQSNQVEAELIKRRKVEAVLGLRAD
ncbi:hypothetical protein FRB95_000301 [Tulasnella sp. JGI-2019a]|nr:hypothetical protein FRB95_000301 [Tulasnella sp. JGI-2019a]